MGKKKEKQDNQGVRTEKSKYSGRTGRRKRGREEERKRGREQERKRGKEEERKIGREDLPTFLMNTKQER